MQLRSELYAQPAAAYSSDKSCMRIRPPHTAGRAVCVGMVHMIFSGSSKGTHTAHNDFCKLTYIQFTSLVVYVFVFSIIIFLYVCVYLLL